MRRERWELLFALAEDQHGAFTVRQARELGIDDDCLVLPRARRDKLVDRLRGGVWAIRALIDDWTVMAGLQLAQPRAIAALRAGAALHRFDGVDEISMDVLVPPNVRMRGPNVHRASDLVLPEIVVIDGLRCTDVVRTIVDWAAVVDDEHLERGMESLFRRDPSARALVVERATALARPGKRGPSRVLKVEARTPAMPTGSDLETVYWQVLVHHGVPLPARQHPVGPFLLDCAWADIKLFAELDGYASHSSHEAFVKDRHRQNFVVARDWTPLRFSDSDVRRFGRRTAMQTMQEVNRRRARWMAEPLV